MRKTIEELIAERRAKLEALQQEIRDLKRRAAKFNTSNPDVVTVARLLRELEVKYERPIDEVLAVVEDALQHKVPAVKRVKLLAKVAEDMPTKAIGEVVPKKDPKYVNPHNPEQTWTGHGRQPQWVKDHLAAGGSLQDLLIQKEIVEV
jgi:DNA-binding protein H-NS